MKPYPRNNIPYKPITPVYITNNKAEKSSRYSMHRIVENIISQPLEIKLNNSITTNATFNGYYHTVAPNETLYSIAKKYYDNESYYWILAKANGLKDKSLSILPAGIVLIIPNYIELQKTGGYFNPEK